MAGSACAKAALCAGSCLYGIVDDGSREVVEVVVKLAAADNLTEDQAADVIDVMTEFEGKLNRRIREDIELKRKLKTILDL